MKTKTIDEIKSDLESLKSKYEVVVFGSFVEGGFSLEKSDIDVAIITRKRHYKDRKELKRLYIELIGSFHPIYDVKIFELLPIIIQISIVKNHQVVFGNEADLSEYFYYYRKLWNDQRPRIKENQYKNVEEQFETIKRLKNFKENQIIQ